MKSKTRTDDELVTAWKNANITYCLAGGRYKAERNYIARKAYGEELKRRGLPVPTIDDSGVFNGPGSF